ncbi:MAG TPA: outer membrane lipoprotein-sorting protein [Acidobacteriaceae bacterium]|jgi:outer membrane lipoprotein-sorting protein|nr:outer membrane lipoprotein-sorting protein [Acidobacteriaceae bacterium]
MINLRRTAALLLFFSAALVATPASLHAQPKPGHLDAVLRQMDEASLKFQSAEANFRWDLYERVVKQTTTQTGTIYFKKQGTSTIMGAKIEQPSVKLIEFRNGILRLFEPGTNHLTTVDATKNKAELESFLTVGFGGSGKDLAKAWTISDLGDEVIDGVQTAKLDLVPKDPSVRKNCTHMTLWVDPVRGLELKQSLYMPSEDYRTAVYANIKYNQKVDEKQYQIKTDSKTTIDQH